MVIRKKQIISHRTYPSKRHTCTGASKKKAKYTTHVKALNRKNYRRSYREIYILLTIISATIGEIFLQRDASTLAVKITTSLPTTVDATHALLSTCGAGAEQGRRVNNPNAEQTTLRCRQRRPSKLKTLAKRVVVYASVANSLNNWKAGVLPTGGSNGPCTFRNRAVSGQDTILCPTRPPRHYSRRVTYVCGSTPTINRH